MNLRGVNLKGAKLDESNLSRCDIRGTNFSTASLKNAKLIEVRAGTRLDWSIILFFTLILLGIVSVVLWCLTALIVIDLPQTMRFLGRL
jgi:hypothetical protein